MVAPHGPHELEEWSSVERDAEVGPGGEVELLYLFSDLLVDLKWEERPVVNCACMHTHTCARRHTNTPTYKHTYTHPNTPTPTHMQKHTHTQTHKHTHTHTHTRTQKHTHTQTHKHTHTHTHTHTQTHTHTHTHKHTNTHTHTQCELTILTSRILMVWVAYALVSTTLTAKFPYVASSWLGQYC